MIELDYAFLARFAKVSGAGLTVVDGSFTHLKVPGLPGQISLFVAGRLRCSSDETNYEFTVTVEPPDNQYMLNGSHTGKTEQYPIYKPGIRGILFASQIDVPLFTTGIYTVTIRIDEKKVRVLKFEIGLTQ